MDNKIQEKLTNTLIDKWVKTTPSAQLPKHVWNNKEFHIISFIRYFDEYILKIRCRKTKKKEGKKREAYE